MQIRIHFAGFETVENACSISLQCWLLSIDGTISLRIPCLLSLQLCFQPGGGFELYLRRRVPVTWKKLLVLRVQCAAFSFQVGAV